MSETETEKAQIPDAVFWVLALGGSAGIVGLCGMSVSAIWELWAVWKVAASVASVGGILFAVAFVIGLILA